MAKKKTAKGGSKKRSETTPPASSVDPTPPAAMEAPSDVAHILPALRVLDIVAVDELRPDPKNVVKHDEQNLAAIEASLREFGQRLPIVVNRRNMEVEKGNGFLAAAKRIGWTRVAVAYADDDDATQHKFKITDNRTSDLHAWDESALSELLGEYGELWGDDWYSTLALDALELPDDAGGGAADRLPAEVAVESKYGVVVECIDEAQQKQLYERFSKEGHKCRLLTI